MTAQLTLNLEPGIGSRYRSLKECVASGVYQRGLVATAGRIDLSPSHLSEALSGADRRKFDLDDLEAYIERCGDLTPILYLAARYLRDTGAQQHDALAKLAAIAESLPGLLSAAGLPVKQGRPRGAR